MSYSRRSFFAALGRSVIRGLADAAGAMRSVTHIDARISEDHPAQAWLRPPGALPEPAFIKACTECTACQEVCPYQSIRRLGPEFGKAAGTPAIIPAESPCYLCADMPCIAACEPRALQPVSQTEVAMGIAVIALAQCYVFQGQPCDYCVARCPLSEDAISFDDSGLPQVRADGCCGCGVCAYLCPAGAIVITRHVSQSEPPCRPKNAPDLQRSVQTNTRVT